MSATLVSLTGGEVIINGVPIGLTPRIFYDEFILCPAAQDAITRGELAMGGSLGANHDPLSILNGDLTEFAALSPSNDDIIQCKSGGWTNRTIAELKVDLAIDHVTNTSDANKPVSTAQQTALDLKADDTALALKADLAILIVAAPTTKTSVGVKGSIAIDGTYLYICTATNTWSRAALVSTGTW